MDIWAKQYNIIVVSTFNILFLLYSLLDSCAEFQNIPLYERTVNFFPIFILV